MSSSQKALIVLGGLFNLIVFFFHEYTFYNETIFWSSFIIVGIGIGTYIAKISFWNSKKYKKGKLKKSSILLVSFLIIFGSTLVFGNILNGIIIGVNYLGRSNDTVIMDYEIDKIVKYREPGRYSRKYVPRVVYKRNEKSMNISLTDRYNENTNYGEYQTITMELSKGYLGFEIIEKISLNK